jgi:two-component system sensor histidine kinase KdpD
MPRKRRTPTSRQVKGIFVAIASTILITGGLYMLRPDVNPTTVALFYLLTVVLVATFFQRRAALTASVLSAAALNYFFLPPYYTFSIAEAQNWIALLVFLAVAMTVGHLSATSNRRREEAERLYKELEDAFEKASEAEALRRSEKLKTSLLDAVTHDFRTPLTSIKAAVTAMIEDLVLAKEERKLDRQNRGELLEVINEETDRLNTFVGSMVELARFQSGESELKMTPVTAEEIVVKAAKRAKAQRKDHKLRSNVEPSLPPLSVDSRSIVEAVYNLIDNAAKYSPEGSTISITAAKADGGVRFAVEDEGPGIPTEDRESVFERFYRGNKTETGGLGMGLAIVRGIIEAHGGKIWVESGRKGARFVFDLPAAGDGR